MVGGSLGAATAASAAPVYEIDARWAENTPTTVKSGDVVNAEWRVNVNDSAAAPSNAPVDNVNFTLTIENGVFDELPDSCLVEGVDPVSSISEDGKTLICNIGTQDQGTAHVLQTPIVADGETGSQLIGSGSIEGGEADLTPIEIVNDFGMDIRWEVATSGVTLDGVGTPNATADLDLQWTLSKNKRSEAGPQTVVYDLTIDSPAASSIAVGAQRCTPFTSGAANGHPWSGGAHPADSMVSPVDNCMIQQLGPNTFRLTLTGIDYDPANPATKDSTGAALPADQVALASGSVWLRLNLISAGSVTLESSAPTYTSASGAATAQDDPANNTVSKTWFFPGAFTSPWQRGYTGSGGSPYDDTYVVSPGTPVRQTLLTGLPGIDRDDTLPIGMCAPLDTRYLDFQSVQAGSPVPGSVIEYFVGNHATVDPSNAGYNPQAFPCGIAGGWTTTPPADPTTVKAVRVTMTQGQAEAANIPGGHTSLILDYRIKDNVAAGQDVWNFMQTQSTAERDWNPNGVNICATPTPGKRYPCTMQASRDLVQIVVATPYIEKSVDRSTVKPGVPATFSLNYSANVATNLPESVDDYQIVDTLPAGMTYVPDSADPEPVVTTNGSGQQVLTWTLDNVTTNAKHALTYQAVAGSEVVPGSILRNSVVASVEGSTSRPATAQVTVSTNGYTSISKTADKPFIPNLAGDGVGEGSWTVTLKSFDPLPQDYTDTIDILPFNGDDRGTTFVGDYALTGVDAVNGATVYYTTEDPTTLSDDPDHTTNGARNAPSAIWSTTFTPDATAIRVIGPELAPGATQQFTVNIETDGVKGGDLLVNRAQARDGHTELVMRTSAPITVANYYSAALKKYVQDSNGNWRDANDVTDYPKFRVGDTVKYRVVIENTGQGTLRNFLLDDDKQPELGEYLIEELAPGEEETHEYEIVLDENTPQTLVNTACATADTPEDSQVAPTINCDPAGFELDGDPEHEKSLVSAEPIGNGQWQVVYGITVGNTLPYATSYSLEDTLHFTEQAKIASAVVSQAPDGVQLADPAWDGQGNVLIAAQVPLLANDDPAYTEHYYEVTVVADVPLQLDGAGSGEGDPTRCGPDGDDADRAFNNTSAMTDARGDREDDQACAELPSIILDKKLVGDPVKDGQDYTTTYDIVVTNDGGAAGEYVLHDQLRFGKGVAIEKVAASNTDPGNVPVLDTYTGQGADLTDEVNALTGEVELGSGISHTFRVVVNSTVADGVAAIGGGKCADSGNGPGGFRNVAVVTHNGLTDEATACAPFAWLAGGLPKTGSPVGPIVALGAALLVAAGLTSLVLARRREEIEV
ncbi:DUF7507 domain-containing protein [Aeromicrobium phragmitis]|uniref:DUF7507 domain-containing protein n=1 Tax=Aeromicrobium phragmitis TaxID=2478914 RepID=UPI001AA03C81|nr:LPXTG cell wall anchor domain-containing protein [Aeromicrobium phragmitis]